MVEVREFSSWKYKNKLCINSILIVYCFQKKRLPKDRLLQINFVSVDTKTLKKNLLKLSAFTVFPFSKNLKQSHIYRKVGSTVNTKSFFSEPFDTKLLTGCPIPLGYVTPTSKDILLHNQRKFH